MEEFDVTIIGSGPGGYVAAIRCAQLGLKTACIEKRKELGGTCLNVGCIPSKALLYSSELYWKCTHTAEEHGVKTQASFDLPTMMGRKDKVVSGFVAGIDMLFKKNKIARIQGHGKLKDANTIDIDGREIKAKHIILATGSEPISLPFLPFDEKKVISSTGALALDHVPKKLLVIGAGIIGVELGSVYNRLGADVTFIEFLDRICPVLDNALSNELQKVLTKQGMKFHLSHKVIKADTSSPIKLIAEDPNGNLDLEGDTVLISIGRKPYSENLGLDELSIEKDKRGYVQINQNFQTKIPNIYAIGDLVDGPMLAHKASEEGVAVAEIIAGHKPTIEYMAIPSVAYTSPEVAGVGLTEEAAKQKGISYKAGKFPFKANSRARCIGEEEGFVKLLMETNTKTLIGAHTLGPNASELIGEATLAIQKRTTVAELAATCHAHPTLSEALKEAALLLTSGAIHI